MRQTYSAHLSIITQDLEDSLTHILKYPTYNDIDLFYAFNNSSVFLVVSPIFHFIFNNMEIFIRHGYKDFSLIISKLALYCKLSFFSVDWFALLLSFNIKVNISNLGHELFCGISERDFHILANNRDKYLSYGISIDKLSCSNNLLPINCLFLTKIPHNNSLFINSTDLNYIKTKIIYFYNVPLQFHIYFHKGVKYISYENINMRDKFNMWDRGYDTNEIKSRLIKCWEYDIPDDVGSMSDISVINPTDHLLMAYHESLIREAINNPTKTNLDFLNYVFALGGIKTRIVAHQNTNKYINYIGAKSTSHLIVKFGLKENSTLFNILDYVLNRVVVFKYRCFGFDELLRIKSVGDKQGLMKYLLTPPLDISFLKAMAALEDKKFFDYLVAIHSGQSCNNRYYDKISEYKELFNNPNRLKIIEELYFPKSTIYKATFERHLPIRYEEDQLNIKLKMLEDEIIRLENKNKNLQSELIDKENENKNLLFKLSTITEDKDVIIDNLEFQILEFTQSKNKLSEEDTLNKDKEISEVNGLLRNEIMKNDELTQKLNKITKEVEQRNKIHKEMSDSFIKVKEENIELSKAKSKNIKVFPKSTDLNVNELTISQCVSFYTPLAQHSEFLDRKGTIEEIMLFRAFLQKIKKEKVPWKKLCLLSDSFKYLNVTAVFFAIFDVSKDFSIVVHEMYDSALPFGVFLYMLFTEYDKDIRPMIKFSYDKLKESLQ